MALTASQKALLASSGSAARKPEGHSFGGFATNLAHNVRDALVGVVTAPYYLGKAGYNDARVALGYGGSYQLDDFAKGIAKTYQDYYSPLASGDFRGFAQNLYDDPLQIGLDALTVATGGGAAAGRLGMTAAKGGSKLGARVAGKQFVNEANLGMTLAEASARGGARLKDGSWLMPATRDLKLSTGPTVHKIDLPRNPVTRARVNLKESLYKAISSDERAMLNAPKGGARGYFHPDKRGARIVQQQQSRIVKNKIIRATRDVESSMHKLSKAEKVALFYRAQGFTDATDLAKLRSHRQGEHAAQLAKIKQGIDDPTDAKIAQTHLSEDIRRLNDPEVENAILNPSDRVIAAEDRLRLADQMVQEHRRSRVDLETVETQLERAHAPRDIVGLPRDKSKQPVIISLSEKRSLAKQKKHTARGATVPAGYGSDKQFGGRAFAHALYSPDPKRITDQLRQEVLHNERVNHVELRQNLMVPHDPIKHRKGLENGTLTRLAADGQIPKQIESQAAQIVQTLDDLAVTGKGAKLKGETIKALQEISDEIKSSGEIFVIPTRTLEELTTQLSHGQGVLANLLATPTKLWRDFVLSLKGTFYANNFISNLLMGMVAYGPITYTKALVQAGSRRSKSGKLVDDAAPSMAHSGFAREVAKDAGGSEHQLYAGGYKNPANLIHALGQIFAAKGATFTEDNFRRGAMKIELNRAIKDHAKNTGLSKADAMDDLLNDKVAVDGIAQRAMNNMLDYSKMTDFERNKVRPLLPFWAFTRSITGRTVQLTLDEPWKVEVMAALSNYAVDKNEDLLGELPDYMRGIAVASDVVDGKARGVSTYGMNPYSSVSDTAAQIGSVFSGDPSLAQMNPLSSVNPYVKSGIDAITGQDQFTGQPLIGSKGEIYARQLALAFPQYAAWYKYENPGVSPGLERDLRDSLISYGGISTGTINTANIKRNAAVAAFYDQQEQYARERTKRRQEAAAVAAGRR